jgi:hypothetical protein
MNRNRAERVSPNAFRRHHRDRIRMVEQHGFVQPFHFESPSRWCRCPSTGNGGKSKTWKKGEAAGARNPLSHSQEIDPKGSTLRARPDPTRSE